MSLLAQADVQPLLHDAVLTPDQLLSLAQRLAPFLHRFAHCFRRSEQRLHALDVLTGKLSALSRKTCEPIAHHLGRRREGLQDFVGSSPWSDRAVLDTLRREVVAAWNDPASVLAVDGSGFPKKGDQSCGVKRQHCGRLGKVDNCQIGIFLAYICRHGHTLLEHRLFLPPEWANDSQRRTATGVPDEVTYQETWEIALTQIDQVRHEVPHRWVTADAEFGRVQAFRAGLRERGECYVVDVRGDQRCRDLQAPPCYGRNGRRLVGATTNPVAWTAAQPATAWTRFEIRAGEKGPLVVEAAHTRVTTFVDNCPGAQERLVVIRTVGSEQARTWYTLSNAAATVPLADVVWAHAQRHWEEADLKNGKSEVGLGQYEVRGWVGWHHHMTLSLLALWFLVSVCGEEKKNASADGERVARGV